MEGNWRVSGSSRNDPSNSDCRHSGLHRRGYYRPSKSDNLAYYSSDSLHPNGSDRIYEDEILTVEVFGVKGNPIGLISIMIGIALLIYVILDHFNVFGI